MIPSLSRTTRRRSILLLLAVAGTVAMTVTNAAEPFPTKPVRVVVPYTPGGPSDAAMRAVGERMARALGQPVVIENRPGAGTAIGNEAVARAAPDGYTLLFAGSSLTMLPATTKVNYDPVTHFDPIAGVLELAEFLVVRADLPVKTVAELVDHMKKHPGTINFANAGHGAVTYFQAEELRMLAGVEFTNVPYKGAAPALQDLLGGRVQATFDGIASVGPHIASGALRPLAVALPRRSTALPDVPTMAEAGYPKQEAVAWAGLMAPAGTPREVIDRLQAAVVESVADPAVQARLRAMGGEPASTSPKAFGEQLRREAERWPALMRARGITPQ